MNITDEAIKLMEIAKEDIAKVKTISELNEVKSKYIGKKGNINALLKEMKDIAKEKRKEVGSKINIAKEEVEKIVAKRLKEIEKEILNSRFENEKIDITLPVENNIGSIHPIEKIIEEQITIFKEMGYEIKDGPEIEYTEYIFDMLNTPKDHPARELQDTFYISEDMVLRSQTSSIQIRKMLEEAKTKLNNGNIKMICPGKVYRSDSVDKTHSPVFHQMEGLVIGENITMSDLKGTLEVFVKKALGEDTKLRFRPHHFPYTEPSAEVDVSCFVCHGKGCSVCKGEGYIELLGCGMVHPKVLENCGIDSEKYSGFAFGCGMERIAMAKYGIEDMRLLYENDVRFLNQFK